MGAVNEHPQRRRTDGAGWRRRLERETVVAIATFVLLAVIVSGEVRNLFDDRAATHREQRQACVLDNLVQQNDENLRRLRLQAPVIDAASDLITARTPEERAAVEEELRKRVEERQQNQDTLNDHLAVAKDCDK